MSEPSSTAPLQVCAVIFDDFELLDVFGPLEFFGILGESTPVKVQLLAKGIGPVTSHQGPKSLADDTFSQTGTIDVLLVPGGRGTRELVNDEVFLEQLRALSSRSRYTASVCTGAALLAKAGLLKGIQATTNKRAYAWATSQSKQTQWKPSARWIRDGNTWTSSGVTAGMDMTLALIESIYDSASAEEVANRAEYLWNRDPKSDPFSATTD